MIDDTRYLVQIGQRERGRGRRAVARRFARRHPRVAAVLIDHARAHEAWIARVETRTRLVPAVWERKAHPQGDVAAIDWRCLACGWTYSVITDGASS